MLVEFNFLLNGRPAGERLNRYFRGVWERGFYLADAVLNVVIHFYKQELHKVEAV